MKLSNPWVGYLDRSYKQIKNQLISRLRTTVPEITDLGESNILIIILSMTAGLIEQLNYYIDNAARESFLATATRFSSVAKIVKLLDYRIKSSLPASVDLYFTYVDNSGAPVAITEPGIIPTGTIVRTENNIQFITTKSLQINPGQSFGTVTAKQWTKQMGIDIGTTTNLPNQMYALPVDYAHNTLEITIEGDHWTLVDTLARSLPTDKVYIVDVFEDMIPRVRFGNGINGAIPPVNKSLIADFYITLGAEGNQVSADTISIIDTALVLPDPAANVLVTNDLSPTGGADIESIEDIKVNAPLSIRTLDRAVTSQDHEDIAIQAEGVEKAKVLFNCGKDVILYLAPIGGGIASQALLDDTKAYMDDYRMVATRIITKAAGISPVVIKADVKVRYRVDKVATALEIQQVLSEVFSFENQEINGRVAISDVVASVDNMTKVDTIDLTGIYSMPYPFPSIGASALGWERETLPGSNAKVNWRLVYTGSDFRLFYNNSYLTNVAINTVFTDPLGIIKFKILAGFYATGDYWDFTTYPYGKTIQVDDYTVPVVTPQTVILNMI